jgi:hypothetical protein
MVLDGLCAAEEAERVTACQAAGLEQSGEQTRSWFGIIPAITASRARRP